LKKITIVYAKIFCIIFLYAYPGKLSACDGCSCSMAGTYAGILPQFNKNFIGLRHVTNVFTSNPLPSLFESELPARTEHLNRTEIWMRYFINSRWMLVSGLPVQYTIKREGNSREMYGGIADATIQANRIWINTGDSAKRNWKNTLMTGAGLKIPLGRYNESFSPSMQTGSGTWDFILNVNHTIRYKNIGLNADINMRINTPGATYTFGDRIVSGLRMFYWQKLGKSVLLPHAGITGEFAEKDTKRGITQKFTGGNGYYFTAGAEYYFNRFTMGITTTIPLQEKINGGYTETNYRIATQLIYMF